MPHDSSTDTVAIGIARADISPPVGIRSTGFAARGPLTAFHDPLVATAMVVSDGARRVALVSCDLLGLDAETAGEIRAEIRRRVGIDEGSTAITCTHTHYGPDPYRDQSAPDVRAYRANLIHLVAGAVQEAASRLMPALLGTQWGESDIGINRREKLPDGRIVLGNNPSGPIDRALGIVRVEAVDGTPIACAVNFQTHPVSQGGTVSHISADYVGRAREVIETLTGARCLFFQGASANINPILMEPSYASARTLGTRLGCECVKLWETARPQPAQDVRAVRTPIALPRIRYGSHENAQALARSLEQDLHKLRAENAIDGLIWWTERRLARVQDTVRSWETGEALPGLESELQALRIGEWALAMAPGEIFCQIGQQVKNGSPFRDTFFVGYANDSIGYVPVPEAYPEGGYEVMRASQVDPGAASLVVDGCSKLLAELGAA